MGLYDNTLGFSVSIHKFGTSQGVDKQTMRELMPEVSEEAIKHYVSAGRKLIACEEFDRINTLDSAYAMRLKKISVPSYFRKGIYLIPNEKIETVQSRTELYVFDRETLVMELGHAWSLRWQESQEATSGQFGYVECPEWSRVKSRFYVQYGWLTLETPGKLQHLSLDVFQAEQERVRETMREVEENIRVLLRQEACEKTQVFLERLRGLGTGETKRFASSHIEGIREWYEEFLSGRNVTEDGELERIAYELRTACEQLYTSNGVVSAEVLRNQSSFREQVETTFQQIVGELEALVETRSTRVLEFVE